MNKHFHSFFWFNKAKDELLVSVNCSFDLLYIHHVYGLEIPTFVVDIAVILFGGMVLFILSKIDIILGQYLFTWLQCLA